MRDSRRVVLAAGAAISMAMSAGAWAQDDYPNRAVRMVVGFSPGSSTDVAARAIAQELGERLGQTFVVENRPGAASNIAARSVASAAPDGYTVFLGTVANTISVGLQPEISVDLVQEFEPVALVGSVPNLVVTHPSLGVKSIADLIEKAKATPGKISYGSAGYGTSPHVSGELFATMAGVELLHVPYKGSSPAVADLLAGQVQLMFGPASTVLPHIRAGKLDALASTSLERTPSAPELPTVDETGLKGFETSVWFGLNLPKGTPPEVIERLAGAVAQAQQGEALPKLFAAQGIDIGEAGPQAYGTLIARETDKWARLVREAGVKAQ